MFEGMGGVEIRMATWAIRGVQGRDGSIREGMGKKAERAVGRPSDIGGWIHTGWKVAAPLLPLSPATAVESSRGQKRRVKQGSRRWEEHGARGIHEGNM